MNPNTFRTIAIRPSFGNTALACLVLMTVSLLCCEASFAQSSDARAARLEVYLKQSDANGNGSLEPEEMSGHNKALLTRLGVNTDKSVEISKAIKKLNQDSKSSQSSEQSGDAGQASLKQKNLKVPGFGVEKTQATVRSFSSDARPTKTYNQNIVQQTDRAMQRYDRNGDGVLDEGEIKNARWGNPRPSISDLNGDGRLTRDELSERYASREKNSESSRDNDRSRDRDRDRDRDKERERDKAREDYRKSALARPQYTAPSSSKPRTSDRKKNQRYAQSMIKEHDKNKDGKLDESEMEKMRRPPSGADSNGDGFVTTNELAESFGKSNNASSPKSRTTSRNRSVSSRKSSSSSRSRSGSSSMGKLDANGDNQIQMHEFSDEWDEDIVEEYYEADKNRDGVITAAEWSER